MLVTSTVRLAAEQMAVRRWLWSASFSSRSNIHERPPSTGRRQKQWTHTTGARLDWTLIGHGGPLGRLPPDLTPGHHDSAIQFLRARIACEKPINGIFKDKD